MCFSSKKLIFFQKKHNARTLVLDIINDTEFSLNFSISNPGLKDTEPANRWRDSLLEGFGATRMQREHRRKRSPELRKQNSPEP